MPQPGSAIVVPIPELTGPPADPSSNFMGRLARELLGIVGRLCYLHAVCLFPKIHVKIVIVRQ